MNDYIRAGRYAMDAMLCNRCGCIVPEVRLGTHDLWHQMLGEIRTLPDGGLVEQAPVR